MESSQLIDVEKRARYIYILAACSIDLTFQKTSIETSFDLESVMSNYNCRNPCESKIRSIQFQINEAYKWCIDNVPLSYVDGARTLPLIKSIIVGESIHKSELLTASSIQSVGNVILSADWPLPSIYRLGSLFVHEATHQILFLREVEGYKVRNKSIGYSPWKGTLRHGRLIWHSFWSFSCQLAFLFSRIFSEKQIIKEDESIIEYLANIFAKISVCYKELEERKILDCKELSFCKSAFNEISKFRDTLGSIFSVDLVFENAIDVEQKLYEKWANSLILESLKNNTLR
ncbi:MULTISPECIES: hypothetical protein [Acinetobacter]|uniref:hypothetical protein n=1 Tax=Acinetobacter TaxID=469 RepID=UPI000F73915D|nr:hypothetical protein [Acinetobacter haemolyticus]RSN73135.1 hypothetical protein EA769_15785 [Acinetobacter haemolyticus]